MNYSKAKDLKKGDRVLVHQRDLCPADQTIRGVWTPGIIVTDSEIDTRKPKKKVVYVEVQFWCNVSHKTRIMLFMNFHDHDPRVIAKQYGKVWPIAFESCLRGEFTEEEWKAAQDEDKCLRARHEIYRAISGLNAEDLVPVLVAAVEAHDDDGLPAAIKASVSGDCATRFGQHPGGTNTVCTKCGAEVRCMKQTAVESNPCSRCQGTRVVQDWTAPHVGDTKPCPNCANEG